jgi:protein TonB
MFGTLSSFLRLSLCMLFSLSLHGGVAYYEWAKDSAESGLAASPVVISFLPATEISSPAVPERTQLQPALPSTTMKHRVKKVAPPASAPKVASSSAQGALAKALPKKTMPLIVTEEPQATSSSADMVCMTPQDVVFDDLSEMFSDRQPEVATAAVAKAQDVVPDGAPQNFEKGLLDSEALSAYRSTLIEAIPKYRSNPLPEYPHLARQKHWEGVVWLLVDVSAEGLVDDLRVEQSCGHRVLDRAASRTVRRWQFSPAKRAGLPVSSQARIPVRFRLEDG